ncbi:MAG: radical SAM protein, partial [Desulfuromonadales bacterium]
MLNRLYVHVPFCIKKCHYCAFVSSAPEQKDLVDYPSLLMSELQLQKVEIDPLVSIYFGGGTPSLLQPQQISTMLENISEQAGISINAEITLEVNPGTVDKTTLLAFRSAGINRLSMGIQSFDNCFLEGLGRIHTTEQAHMAFRNAREAGFNNISIDLIHSLPDQTLHQ